MHGPGPQHGCSGPAGPADRTEAPDFVRGLVGWLSHMEPCCPAAVPMATTRYKDLRQKWELLPNAEAVCHGSKMNLLERNPTPTPTLTPTVTPTPTPSVTPTPTPSVTPTPTPIPTPNQLPLSLNTHSHSQSLSHSQSTPTPTLTPSLTPTQLPLPLSPLVPLFTFSA